jgi:hypothetical protein
MLKMSVTGAQYYCDICREPLLDLAEAWGLFAPLNGTPEHVVLAHDACRHSSAVETFLKGYSKRRLAELLSQADEACNRGCP